MEWRRLTSCLCAVFLSLWLGCAYGCGVSVWVWRLCVDVAVDSVLPFGLRAPWRVLCVNVIWTWCASGLGLDCVLCLVSYSRRGLCARRRLSLVLARQCLSHESWLRGSWLRGALMPAVFFYCGTRGCLLRCSVVDHHVPAGLFYCVPRVVVYVVWATWHHPSHSLLR